MSKTEERDAEYLRKKIDSMADGRLKSVLMSEIFPGAVADAPKIERRRGSIQGLLVSKRGGALPEALDLGGIEMGNAGGVVVADLLSGPAFRRLQHLDLACNVLTDLGSNFSAIGGIATALKRNEVITSLNLAKNSLSAKGGVALARALRANKSLQFLDLSRNNLRSQGLEAVAKAIHPDTNPDSAIVSLDVSENNLTNYTAESDGALSLAKAVQGHPAITFLDLSHSRMSKAAISALAFALRRNKTLIDVRLDDNKIDLDAAKQLADSLMTNKTLTRLSMNENTIFNEGAAAIAEAMAISQQLHYLDVRNCYVNDDGRVQIAQYLWPTMPALKDVAAAQAGEEDGEGGSALATDAGAAGDADADGSDSDDEIPAALRRAAGAAGVVESKGSDGSGAGGGAADDAEAKAATGATAAAADDGAGAGGDVVAPVDWNAKEMVLVVPVTGQVVVM